MSEEQVKPKTAEELMREQFNNAKPEEAAAAVYSSLIKTFNIMVEKLSKKGAIRLLHALVKVPFEDFNKVLSKEEKNMYAITDRLMQCKFIMESAIIQEELEAQETVKEEEIKNG